MINVNIYLSQALIPDELFLKDKNAVIIDVLRATSTIHTALENSAKEVIPVDTPSVAARISKGLGNSLLCGERYGKIIEGFNLGNSPLEYNDEKIKNKSLIFSTTNGSVSIVKSKFAKKSYLASFLNLSAITNTIIEYNEDVTIICSGKLNDFCIEDSLAAGMILMKITEQKGKNYISLKDSGYICYKLAKTLIQKTEKIDNSKILYFLKKSEHGKYLMSLGFEKDLEYCAEIDKYSSIPLFKNNTIKLKDKIALEEANKSKLKRISITQKPISSKHK